MAGNNEFKYSKTDATKWAQYIINNNCSLLDASKHFNVSPATIWRYIKNMTSQEIQDQITVLLSQHQKDSPHKAISIKWQKYYTSQSK